MKTAQDSSEVEATGVACLILIGKVVKVVNATRIALRANMAGGKEVTVPIYTAPKREGPITVAL